MTSTEDLIEQIKNSTDTFRKNQCRHTCLHTLPDGDCSGSPAMRWEKFCYYHHETRKPVADAKERHRPPQCVRTPQTH